MIPPMVKSTEYLGLPLWKRLYGFGDELTIRAAMTNVFLGGIDREAVARALPVHPLVRLHRRSPLLLVHTDFLSLRDRADPDGNDFPAHEVMVAVMLEPTVGRAPPLFPLILFVDEPVSIAAGREFHGFPKVLSAIHWRDDGVRVEYASFPNRRRTLDFCLETRWASPHRERSTRLVTGLRSLARVAEMLGLGPGARTLEEMALNAAGEVWNLRQLPDLANPKRAVISQLTRFKPTIRDPGAFRLLRDVRVDFASGGPWPLAGMFSPEGPKVLGGFAWEATMIVKGGDVIDSW